MRPLFVQGLNSGAACWLVDVPVVTPGMATAWAGAPSEAKKDEQGHRMTHSVRKETHKTLSIDGAGEENEMGLFHDALHCRGRKTISQETML